MSALWEVQIRRSSLQVQTKPLRKQATDVSVINLKTVYTLTEQGNAK